MKTKDFIEQLNKEFNLKEDILTVRPNNNIPGLSNIFLGKAEICACPSEDIFEEQSDSHFVMFNGDKKILHPNIEQTKGKISMFIHKWNNEEGFKELMTEEI